MGKAAVGVLAIVLALGRTVRAEDPAWKRLLTGDDAKKAAALVQQLAALEAAGKFADAVTPAEELRALRQKGQGDTHWQAADAARKVRELKQAAGLPQAQQQRLTEAVQRHAEAEILYARGLHAAAEPLYRKALTLREEALGPRHVNTAYCCHSLASNLLVQGKARDAEPLFRKAVAIREEVLGPRHPDTATSYNELARTLHVQGRARDAEPLFHKALAIWEEALGPKHSYTAQSYNNLATNLQAQGQARQAEPLYRKAVAIREEVLGPRHPETARSYTNLGLNLEAQGKARDAEPLYRKALALRKEILGPKHPDTATSYNALAQNLSAQGKARDAEPLCRQALAIHEEVFGPQHPETATSYNNLAATLGELGQARDAELFFRKALAIREAVLGPRHPDTARSYNNLAYNLQAQGKARDAEPLYRKALALWEEVLGPKHPDTARSYDHLAGSLHAQGKLRDAEPLYRKALAIREDVLGPRHSETGLSYNNLGYNLQAQGRARDAEVLFRKALTVFEEVLGPKHSYTARGYNNLARTLYDQGRARDAEPLYRKALAIKEEVLGPRHPDTAHSYGSVAANLEAQGRARDAEPLYRKALAIREDVLGPKHPDTATSYNSLARNLSAQGKKPDAEPLERQALAIREEVLGPKHPDTALSYSNLGANLQGQAKARDAEPLCRRALAIWEEVLGPQHFDTAIGYLNVASNLDAQGKYRDALTYWGAAIEALEAARLRLTASGLDRAAATRIAPHAGLALSRARQGKATEAWHVAERGLARGLLDDLSAAALTPEAPEELPRLRARAARLEQLDKELLPLLSAQQLDQARTRQRDDLLRERDKLQQEVAAEAARRAGREVVALESLQQHLRPEVALAFWVDVPAPPGAADPGAFHYGCVVRCQGAPAWVRLPGRGPAQAWTDEDGTLPGRLREALAQRSPAAAALAQQLAAQRLEPLTPYLAATANLPAVSRLIVIPAGAMAGVPLEALTDRYAVSYAPSASVFVRQAANHRPLREPTLLALGDPAFAAPETKRPEPPRHGLLALQVLAGSNAAKAGLRDNDVLLSYGGTDLHRFADLRVRSEGGPVSARAWRDGTTRELTLAPGRLGVVFHKEPAPVALRQRQQLDTLLAATRGEPGTPLPGSRREVQALAGLFPKDRTTVLLGSEASEQCLDELAAAGRLKDVRILHLATHGRIDPASAHHSALLLAADRLPDEAEQVKQNKKVYTGELKVQALAAWRLDADLVTLSACETGLGQKTAGDGFLGFTHMLLAAGARSLVVSLWEVDDASTALLMMRFYENLLGQRADLKGPLGRAEALRQAQRWLHELRRPEAEALAAQLSGGVLRGTIGPEKAPGPGAPPVGQPGDRPFAHSYYWSAFILLGDPD
jgi:Tfp pilus assembly protein PilF